MGEIEPVRIGLVGYGFGGRWFHAPFLAAATECEFAGVVTTSDERRALVRADHQGVDVFDDLRQLVEAGAEAVAISPPAATHTDLTDAALELGLAVVCDKPFALDAGAATHTMEVARASGSLVVPFQNRRWDSDFLTVRKLIDEGELGEVRQFESGFERYAPDQGPGPAGGGVLLDFGSHLVDQALVLFGPVQTVYCEFRPRDTGFDDDVFVALTHASGVRSHLSGSWSQHAPGLRFRVTGTEASYHVPGPMDSQEAQLLNGMIPGADGWGIEPSHRWGRLVRRDDEDTTVPSLGGSWNTFYPAVARAVRGVGDVPVAVEDAVRTATVLDAARASAGCGEVVVI